MPIAETVVPSSRSRVTQGAPGGQVGLDDGGVLELAPAVAVDHHEPVGLGDDPRPGQRVAAATRPAAPARPAWRPGRPVNAARVSASKETQANTDARRPAVAAEDDARRGGRRADARCAGATRRRRLAEPAGMDVGEQDAASAEVVELVHQPLGAGARAPSPAPRPSPRDAAGRRSGSRCPGVEGDGRVDAAGRDVVVHHHVVPRDQDALEPAPEDLEPGRRVAAAGDQHGLGLEDRARRRSPARPRAAWCRSRRRRRSTSATPSWMLVSTAPSSRMTVGVDAALLEEGAHDADVRRGDALAGELLEVGEPPRRARRTGTRLRPNPRASTSSALAPESSSRSRPVMPTSSVPSPT